MVISTLSAAINNIKQEKRRGNGVEANIHDEGVARLAAANVGGELLCTDGPFAREEEAQGPSRVRGWYEQKKRS